MKEGADEENREVSSEEELHTVPKIPEAVDDFLRNFLRKAGLSRTLNLFEAEWYGSAQTLRTDTLRTACTGVFMPDALTHGQLLRSELETVRAETYLLRRDVLVAGESLVRTQKERDFHRLQYRRVAEEKNRLIKDFKQLRKHLESYEPALRQLEDKYQAALRHKTLISLEKDRVQNTTDARLNEEKAHTKRESRIKRSDSANKSPANSTTTTSHPKDTQFPVCSRLLDRLLAQGTFEKRKSHSSFSLSYSFRAHKLPISCIDLHPRNLVLATTSDDRSWRLWELLPNGEKVGQMVLTGEGHSDWLSGCSFHPDGAKLATTSGDSTVRLWDFSRGCCVLSLSGHGQPTWGCSFHSCGHFLASCSADRTAKLWDLNSQRCRLTLRRHAASVNSVCFLPYSNLLLTCSADKTLATWDARLGVCTADFHGHQHPCNHAAFSPASDVVASCDTRGVVNLWDTRKPALATATVDAGPMAANQVAFSPSGKTLAVASSDGLVRVVEVDSGVASSLSGHGDGVQSVTFDHEGETVMSAGSDGVVIVWAGRENLK
ncbi:sperm-associated antigen 16 protein [Cebidichthys violaceus]|uniref:sperm-associated antigen 16 protein n=1 Tax=Cebidichthys violaceus TaxID=271503 RepID=UPI0035C9E1B8